MTRCGAMFALLALVAAAAPAAARERPAAWRTVIRADDRRRLANLWQAWTRSLYEARAAHGQPVLDGLGGVVMPLPETSAALPLPGAYRCRTVKLGGSKGSAAVSAGPFGPCTIGAGEGLLHFDAATSGRRIRGALYPDGDRMVFLGSVGLQQEMGVMAYGADRDRDQVGVLRTIGDQHWRIELPWPKWESNLDLIEIVEG